MNWTANIWGRGYATEAAQAILQFGFQELGLHRIWANTLAVNKGSANVLAKLGMRQEAKELEKDYIKGAVVRQPDLSLSSIGNGILTKQEIRRNSCKDRNSPFK